MITRRDALALAAGFGTLVSRPARAAGALESVTLRVATFRGFDATLMPAAGQDRTPYKVDYAFFTGGNLETQAINAGAVDMGSWSEIPLVFAAASNASVRVVAVMQGDTSNQAVMVPKGSTARSVADLKGKRVGYVRATTAQYFLLKMLHLHGLGWNDIQPIDLGVTEGLTAIQSGAVDAWATYGYAIEILQARSGARVLQNANGILSGNYLVGVQPKLLEDATVCRAIADYIGRLDKTYRTLEADPARWAKIVAPVVQVPEPLVLHYLSNLSQPFRLVPVSKAAIASAQDVADTFTAAGLLPRHVDVAPWFSDALTPLLARV